ncbi:KR domain-containing protein [Sesbania bispinosa]|nr:KR domain-containing protein [Sesbania bispinosa]
MTLLTDKENTHTYKQGSAKAKDGGDRSIDKMACAAIMGQCGLKTNWIFAAGHT